MTSPKQIVFVGLPGSGKTSVGRLVAARLGCSFRDADQVLSEQAGMSIPEIFATRGEDGFRELEVKTIAELLASDAGVISLGGGALTREETRSALAGKDVVFLDVSLSQAAARVGKAANRPLLADIDSSIGKLAQLEAERRDSYLEAATLIVPANGTLSQVSSAVMRGLGRKEQLPMRRYYLDALATLPAQVKAASRVIPVTSGAGYQVIVGQGAGAALTQMLQERPRKIFLIYPPPLSGAARALATSLTQSGQVVKLFEHPDGEGAKNIRIVEDAWRCLGENHFSREDAVVALGGGATTDMAGFVAATWLRGIELFNLPTSLLAMVDAAIGGKTGINTSLGKNLVGSFYPPSAVICDLDYLQTLPPRQLHSGLAEVIKCGFIADRKILQLLNGQSPEKLVGSPAAAEEVISRAINVKAGVVSEDLREGGMRECLNYGHTLAHAIEKASSYQVLHGEAVAIGMVFAAQVAVELNLLTPSQLQSQRRQIAALGLPTTCPQYSFKQLLKIMASDKKVRGGVIRMVLTTGNGQIQVTPITDYHLLERAFNAINQADSAAGSPSLSSQEPPSE